MENIFGLLDAKFIRVENFEASFSNLSSPQESHVILIIDYCYNIMKYHHFYCEFNKLYSYDVFMIPMNL